MVLCSHAAMLICMGGLMEINSHTYITAQISERLYMYDLEFMARRIAVC